jgi:glycosyltransferase involved in cell wall biosynthesis
VKRADIFVAPSLHEYFGLIYIEAGQWCVPVIGTTAGGIPEFVTHDKTGFLVDPANSNDLGMTICRLLHSENSRMKLANAGYLHVRNEYSTSKLADRAFEVYKDTTSNFDPRIMLTKICLLKRFF